MVEDLKPKNMAPKSSCPICGKPMQIVYRPFCSRRCADVDLSRWLKGEYAIPAIEAESLEEFLDEDVVEAEASLKRHLVDDSDDDGEDRQKGDNVMPFPGRRRD